MESYTVFVRNWWRWEYKNGKKEKVPDPGARRTKLMGGLTEEEARALCADHAKTHKPGALSRKAEYTSNY